MGVTLYPLIYFFVPEIISSGVIRKRRLCNRASLLNIYFFTFIILLPYVFSAHLAHPPMSCAVPELDFSYKRFLDKTTLLYGESGTGKSYVIVDILYQLAPHADQIIVISPTDRQNHTYDRGIVPLPCIHYTLTPKLLDDLWERQGALSAVYSKANNKEVLSALFGKIANKTHISAAIAAIHKKLGDLKRELDPDDPSSANMEAECKKLILMIWVNTINENRHILGKMRLTKDESFSLKYLNLNPRMVLIFDDCTDLLKKYKGHPVMQKLFYQGRHSFITSLIACHTDKALDPELKKNAFVSIFTEESSAHAYFERKTNDLDLEARRRAAAAVRVTFSPIAKHQKLAWLREEKKFYRFTSVPHTFKFGNQYIWDYCESIKAEAGALSMDNKFIGNFTV